MDRHRLQRSDHAKTNVTKDNQNQNNKVSRIAPYEPKYCSVDLVLRTSRKIKPHTLREVEILFYRMNLLPRNPGPDRPELPWRDDRTAKDKVIPEGNYYCCPYSKERSFSWLTRTPRPVTSTTLGTPVLRRQWKRKYRLGRLVPLDDKIPYFLRNSDTW